MCIPSDRRVTGGKWRSLTSLYVCVTGTLAIIFPVAAVNLQEPLTTVWGILPFPSRTVVPRWLMTSLSACMTGALLIPHHPHDWWWTKWLLMLPGLWSHVYKDPWRGCIEYPIVIVLLASKLQWLPAVWERYKLLPPLCKHWSFCDLTKLLQNLSYDHFLVRILCG